MTCSPSRTHTSTVTYDTHNLLVFFFGHTMEDGHRIMSSRTRAHVYFSYFPLVLFSSASFLITLIPSSRSGGLEHIGTVGWGLHKREVIGSERIGKYMQRSPALAKDNDNT